jgi:hypothetical protein
MDPRLTPGPDYDDTVYQERKTPVPLVKLQAPPTDLPRPDKDASAYEWAAWFADRAVEISRQPNVRVPGWMLVLVAMNTGGFVTLAAWAACQHFGACQP